MRLRIVGGAYLVLQWLKYPCQFPVGPDWLWRLRILPRREGRLSRWLVAEILRLTPPPRRTQI